MKRHLLFCLALLTLVFWTEAAGNEESKRDEEAARWTRLAAEQGHADAQFSLGMMYLNGVGVEHDLELAQEWLEKAASQGNSEAQYQLGRLLSDELPAQIQDPTHQSDGDVTAEFRQCAFVDPPVLADGSTASRAEIEQLGDDIRTYMARMQASLECLTTKEEQLADQLTKSQRDGLTTIYNNGVDQIQYIAEEYNKQLRIYRMSRGSYSALNRPDD